MKNTKPIICHLIYRFDIGGLERVMVNFINAMQDEHYQHVVIALTEVTDFSKLLNDSVDVYQLDKKPGKDLKSHWRLFKLLWKIKPRLLHSYNLSTIEYHPIAKLAGVKANIHAEHGRDNSDPLGLNKKHNLLRRLMAPFIHYFVPVSTDLEHWLKATINIPNRKNILIRNGINTNEFNCQQKPQTYNQDNNIKLIRLIHVARLDPVKNQAGLLQGLALLVQRKKLTAEDIHLTIVGDGNQMTALVALSEALGVSIPSFHVGLIAFGLLYSPISEITGLIMNLFSRKFEYQADDYAKNTYKVYQTIQDNNYNDSFSILL